MAGHKQTILFVINKRSGRKKNPDRLALIKTYAAKNGLIAQYYVLPRKPLAEKLRETISSIQPDIVVAVGGDGTVSMVAELLRGTGKLMGIIPAGSANGMARELEIPEETNAALDLLLKGNTVACDLVQVNDKWLCMHLSDIGLNARLVKYFQQGAVRGFPGYTLALIKALRRKTNFKTVLQTRDGVKSVEAIMVLFANASKYGTGATINHIGSLTDGLFEVVVVKKIGPAEIWKMFFGTKGFNPDHIELHQAHSVVVHTHQPAHLQVDGEYLGKVAKVEAKMLPEKLNVLVP